MTKLTTKLHFHHLAYESGKTLGPHIHRLNQCHIQGPTKDGTLLLGLHWGLWNLLINDPARGCQYPPCTAQW